MWMIAKSTHLTNLKKKKKKKNLDQNLHWITTTYIYGAFTLDVKSMLNGNLGGILGGTQC
jgi:hypothetical protein